MNRRLTQQTVEKAKAPKTGQLLVRDGEVRGFALGNGQRVHEVRLGRPR